MTTNTKPIPPIYAQVTASLGFSLEDMKLPPVKTPAPMSKRQRHRLHQHQNAIVASVSTGRGTVV